jgi:hypothetical protein
MTKNTSASRNGFGLLCKVTPAMYLLLCAPYLSSVVNAQEPRIITFDAPGADTKPGDNNGTYSSGINASGAITGSYQDTNENYHGFLRSPDGKFTTFEAPGADTGAYNGTSPAAINDLGVMTGRWTGARTEECARSICCLLERSSQLQWARVARKVLLLSVGRAPFVGSVALHRT